jgi:hypothetical protein
MIGGNSPLYFSGHVYSTHREKHRAKQAVHKSTKAQADLDLARAQEDLATFESTKEARQRIQHLTLRAKETGLTHDVDENQLSQALLMSKSEIELSKKTGKIRQQADRLETEARLIKAAYDRNTMVDLHGTKAAKELLSPHKDKESDEEEGNSKLDFYS